MKESTWYQLVLSLGVLLCYYSVRRKSKRTQLPLPPGPKKLPLVGNLFDIPIERQWEAYHQWSRKFDSDIIHVDVAGTSMIILSSMTAIRELFERRSTLYSDRPRLPMLVELMGWDYSVGFMPYGNNWRAHRKMLHDAFNIGAAKQFHPQERAATHSLLRRLLRDPQGDVMAHLRHMAGALIMDLTYGIKVESVDDPYIVLAKQAMHGLAVAGVPGAFLVDTIPALKYIPGWLPGAGFRRQAQKWRKVTREMLEKPFIQTKQRIRSGSALPSFSSFSLQTLEESRVFDKKAQEEVIKHTAGNMYAAGSDTTVAVLGTFVLAMLAYPEAQKMAQAELDAVLGTGILPDFSDEPSLPYLSALVKEVFRWRNVAPIGFPHYITVEDEFAGYRIPAHSIVIGNIWSLLHDKELYPDPHSFNPERFLLNGKIDREIMNPDVAAFGFGRRVCPGKHMATASIWLTIASVLATFNIEKAVDASGNVIEPSHEYFPGLVSPPLPFKCSIIPRSPQAVEAIRATGI